MSLFVVNRYQGEEKAERKDEKKHLSELLKRIEERKRDRANQSENQVTQRTDSKDIDDPPRKKKKRKKEHITEYSEQNVSTTESVTAEPQVENETETEDQQKVRKKKKKKKVDTQDEETNVEVKTPEAKDQSLPNDDLNNQENESSEKLKDVNNVEKETTEKQSEFIVLGGTTKSKKKEVKRVLPDWLANPEIIPLDLNSGPSLEECDSIIDSKFIEILKANGVNKLFPVQDKIMTWLMKCNKDRQEGWWLRDTCVSAPTGSGKTLAYVLPIVQILQSRLIPKIRCLVVVPVQELAAQVFKVMTTYTAATNLRVGLLSGASSFEQEQNSVLRKTLIGEYTCAVDIVVATPGRLIDHILKTPKFSLHDLRFLVIDEADRAADWLEYIPEPHYRAPRLTLHNMRNSKIPAQKLLFSATLSQDPEKLNRLGLLQPILFTSVLVTGKDEDINLDKEVGDFVGRYTSPEELTELAVQCAAEYKPLALYELLVRNNTVSKTLVFTHSGESAHRLAILLGSILSEKKIAVGEISAQLMPKQRENVLKKFITGELQVLVSSDALARGVDISDIQLVISYDLPKHIKGYIHRAGRTGRAGKAGTAVSVLTSRQVGIFKHMLSNAHKVVPDIEKLELSSIANTINYSYHVEKLKETLEKEKHTQLQRAKAAKRVQPVTAE